MSRGEKFSRVFTGFDRNSCINLDGLCGLGVRLPGYRSRGPGFDSQRYQIF
jgi:hypothetical protein